MFLSPFLALKSFRLVNQQKNITDLILFNFTAKAEINSRACLTLGHEWCKILLSILYQSSKSLICLRHYNNTKTKIQKTLQDFLNFYSLKSCYNKQQNPLMEKEAARQLSWKGSLLWHLFYFPSWTKSIFCTSLYTCLLIAFIHFSPSLIVFGNPIKRLIVVSIAQVSPLSILF